MDKFLVKRRRISEKNSDIVFQKNDECRNKSPSVQPFSENASKQKSKIIFT